MKKNLKKEIELYAAKNDFISLNETVFRESHMAQDISTLLRPHIPTLISNDSILFVMVEAFSEGYGFSSTLGLLDQVNFTTDSSLFIFWAYQIFLLSHHICYDKSQFRVPHFYFSESDRILSEGRNRFCERLITFICNEYIDITLLEDILHDDPNLIDDTNGYSRSNIYHLKDKVTIDCKIKKVNQIVKEIKNDLLTIKRIFLTENKYEFFIENISDIISMKIYFRGFLYKIFKDSNLKYVFCDFHIFERMCGTDLEEYHSRYLEIVKMK